MSILKAFSHGCDIVYLMPYVFSCDTHMYGVHIVYAQPYLVDLLHWLIKFQLLSHKDKKKKMKKKNVLDLVTTVICTILTVI